MKVKDLIIELSECDPEADVQVEKDCVSSKYNELLYIVEVKDHNDLVTLLSIY